MALITWALFPSICNHVHCLSFSYRTRALLLQISFPSLCFFNRRVPFSVLKSRLFCTTSLGNFIGNQILPIISMHIWPEQLLRIQCSALTLVMQLQSCTGFTSKPVFPFKPYVLIFNSRSISLQNTISWCSVIVIMTHTGKKVLTFINLVTE